MRALFLTVLASAVLLFSYWSQAKWIEASVEHDVLSTDAKEIAGLLTLFPDTLNYLNADNLTSPHRLIVTRFTGRMSYFNWQNDEDCAVKDPSTVLLQKVYQTQTQFFYVNDPTEVFTFDNFNAPPTPCDKMGNAKVFSKKTMMRQP